MGYLDAAAVGCALLGVTIGAQRGLLRQVALMVSFYAALVVAAAHSVEVAWLVRALLPRADASIAALYGLVAITLFGTCGLAWLFSQAYQATALAGWRLPDRVIGALLGLVLAWTIAGFLLTVVLHGLSFSWGSHDATRVAARAAVERSPTVALARLTWPHLRDGVAPWVPGGLPAPLTP